MNTDVLDSSLECVATVAEFCMTLVEASRNPGLGSTSTEKLSEAAEGLIEALKSKVNDLQDQGAEENDIRIMQRLSGAVELAAEVARQKVVSPSAASGAPFRLPRRHR